MKHIILLLALVSVLAAQDVANQNLDNLTPTAKANLEALGVLTDDAGPDNTAVNTAIATDPAATRAAAIAAYAHADERLWNYRDRLSATGAKPRIAIIGDSMVNLSWSQGLKDGLVAAFGDGGLGFAFGTASAGATLVQTDCTKWISGNYWTVPLNGEVMFHGGGASIAIPATALRIYYVKQPGGGHFKVQYERNSGSWTDVPTLTDIDTDDTLGGAVATYDLTAVSTALANYRIKVVGLGDGAGGAATANPIIIGGALVNSLSDGAEISLIANNSSSSPSNNIDAASATPTAITDPIFAALSPNLILLSNYDGGTMNQTYLPTFMDNVDQGIATGSGSPVASWVLIGPPPGESAETDAQLASQAAVMRSIAKERGQSFFDNREWAGGYAAAEAAGLMVSGDVHYQALAVKQWVPMMIHSLGLDRATKLGSSNVGQLRFAKGAIIEDAPTTSNYYPVARLLGSLDISNHPGETNRGYIQFLDTAGAANESDFARISYTDNRWTWNLANGSAVVKMSPGSGFGFELYDNASNTSTPRGVLGTSAQPLRRLFLSKDEAGATGNRSSGMMSGTVKFAAASGTPIVVTHSLATATSNIMATVYGTDATLTSVRVTRAAGSFTITPNAAATDETTVGWAIFP